MKYVELNNGVRMPILGYGVFQIAYQEECEKINNIAINHGKASECIGCKLCEGACPQHLPITAYLGDVIEKFEKNSIIPTRK